jgi:hypothetical protein
MTISTNPINTASQQPADSVNQPGWKETLKKGAKITALALPIILAYEGMMFYCAGSFFTDLVNLNNHFSWRARSGVYSKETIETFRPIFAFLDNDKFLLGCLLSAAGITAYAGVRTASLAYDYLEKKGIL